MRFGSLTKDKGTGKRPVPRYSAEVRERVVRLVQEQRSAHKTQWAAIRSTAEKSRCSPETLRRRLRRTERDAGQRPGVKTDERERLQALEREVRALKRAHEIRRKASALFAAAEFDRYTKYHTP